jgi:hypothetical protein
MKEEPSVAAAHQQQNLLSEEVFLENNGLLRTRGFLSTEEKIFLTKL